MVMTAVPNQTGSSYHDAWILKRITMLPLITKNRKN